MILEEESGTEVTDYTRQQKKKRIESRHKNDSRALPPSQQVALIPRFSELRPHERHKSIAM